MQVGDEYIIQLKENTPFSRMINGQTGKVERIDSDGIEVRLSRGAVIRVQRDELKVKN